MEGVQKSKQHGYAEITFSAAWAGLEGRHTVFTSGIMNHIGLQRKGLYGGGTGVMGGKTMDKRKLANCPFCGATQSSGLVHWCYVPEKSFV